MPLRKLNIRGMSASINCQGQLVFPIPDTHTLVQAAGYLKHIQGNNHSELIYFRGESKLHQGLSPTAFRGISSHKAMSKVICRINTSIANFSRPLSSTKSYAHEALLQHYGLKTTWIDVVDNIWVALWFACHTVRAFGPFGEYLHFERRIPRQDSTGKSYVLLVAADAAPIDRIRPGFYSGKKTELIDLRIAAPSVFVRPHAQHGLLMRKRGDKVQRPADYGSQVRGILEIDLSNALEWLGNSTALSTHSLFPPPSYDNGYGNLLRVGFKGSQHIGCITHIGA